MTGKRIAILCGGPSPERAVSLKSAAAIEGALVRMGHTVQQINLVANWMESLKKFQPAFVYLGLHGCPGEDGTVQAVLDLMNLPYNGSGMLASALAMDKPLAKRHYAMAGLPVAAEELFEPENLPTSSSALPFGLPAVVKPARGGSTLGVSLVFEETQWAKAMQTARTYGEAVLVEEYIPGREFSTAVMGEGENAQVLGTAEIHSNNDQGFYDYTAKYATGGSKHDVPPSLSPSLLSKMEDMALTAHRCLGCGGVTRSDIRYDEKTKRMVILETNTLPGMTETSLVPEIAAARGIGFDDLIAMIMGENPAMGKKEGGPDATCRAA